MFSRNEAKTGQSRKSEWSLLFPLMAALSCSQACRATNDPYCYPSNNSRKLIQICNLVLDANERVRVTGVDFGYPSKKERGPLAWDLADFTAHDKATKMCKRVHDLEPAAGFWHTATEAKPAKTPNAILVINVSDLIDGIHDSYGSAIRDTQIVPLLEKVCNSMRSLGYKKMYVIEPASKDKHPGYRLWRECQN